MSRRIVWQLSGALVVLEHGPLILVRDKKTEHLFREPKSLDAIGKLSVFRLTRAETCTALWPLYGQDNHDTLPPPPAKIMTPDTGPRSTLKLAYVRIAYDSNFLPW